MHHHKSNVFKRLFIIYSVIIVIILSILCAFVTHNIKSTIKNNQLYLNSKMTESVAAYFSNLNSNSKVLVNYLYGSSAQLWDVINFLKMDYHSYINERLSNYCNSRLFTYDSLNTFVSNCYQFGNNVHNVIFYSYKADKLTICDNKGGMKAIFHVDKRAEETTKSLKKMNVVERCLAVLKAEDQKAYNAKTDIGRYYYVAYEIKNPYKLEACGLFIAKYELGDINDNLSKFDYDKNEILALDGNGTVIYDSNNRYDHKNSQYLEKLKSEGNTARLDKLYYKSLRNVHPDITVAGILTEQRLYDGFLYLIYITYILSFLMMVIAEIFAYNKIRGYSNRTTHILEAMDELQQGNFKARIETGNENDDLSLISNNFNHMCIKLDEYIERVYMAEISKKDAQISAFQNQINPHFLYNTLESIRMKAVLNGDKEVGRMLYIMAALFRNMVKGGSKTTLSQEIEYCKMYLELFQYRFDNAFRYDIKIDSILENKEIMKFIIQPIVENYVLHGIRNGEEDNLIRITVEQIEDSIRIIVCDNGKGIEEEKMEEIKESLRNNRSSNSIGLLNVHNRIRLTYGDAYGVELDRAASGGTLVKILIPMKGGMQNVQCNAG